MKNKWEKRWDTERQEHFIVIFLNTRKFKQYGNKDGYIETYISVESFEKADEYEGTWGARYDQRTEGFYVQGGGGNRPHLHRWVTNCPEGKVPDHINHNTLDNRLHNLRITTPNSNQHNTRKNRNNTSGYTGVHFCEANNKFKARIVVNGKNIHLGYFNSAKEAHKGYTEAKTILHDLPDNLIDEELIARFKEELEIRKYHNRSLAKRGNSHPCSKLTENIVYEMRLLYLQGVSITDISEKYGVKRNTASQAIHGTNWKHVPFPTMEVAPRFTIASFARMTDKATERFTIQSFSKQFKRVG